MVRWTTLLAMLICGGAHSGEAQWLPPGYLSRPAPPVVAPPPAETMRYRGPSNAGVTNSLDVTPIGPGRYRVTMDGGSRGCGASYSGVAVEQRGVLQIREGTRSDLGTYCSIDIRLSGDRATIQEDLCNPYHGMSCEFGGTLRRVSGPGGGAAPPRPATEAGEVPVASACPAALDGHPASGAAVYEGSTEEQDMQAPGTPAGPNTWEIGDRLPFFARCSYRGTGATQVIRLSPGVRLCRFAGLRLTCR